MQLPMAAESHFWSTGNDQQQQQMNMQSSPEAFAMQQGVNKKH